ncbi:putative bifunctional diguanylate cyclase/phosphodiesterase [Sphingomicrobium nitratireducens]|uniref:putative bifunctional diguanylate cyclase/phosphodiesterase n=1 Tax=Sphingomicrobium nitratireducens TaxID=2964666 RepID=UPI00223EAC2D
MPETNSRALPARERQSDQALLDALPIAATVVGLKGEKLWVYAFNSRFAEAISGPGAAAPAKDAMDSHGEGPVGDFVRAFLADPAGAKSELALQDGEGIGSRHFTLKLAPLHAQEDGTPCCLLSLVDKTVEVQAERNLRAEMLRDSLTGLPNRLAFTETIEKFGEMPTRSVDHAVLVIDVLRFSRINESMGSLAGDELLITFARRLMSALRAGDTLARTGGNEFGILVALKRGVQDALAAAARIQELLSTPFKLSELEIKVDCAIGIALMNGEQDAEELFRNAQFAVKQAKQVGKPTVYEPGEAADARRRFSIETELRRAIDRDELELYYQPLINLRSGTVAGYEALARWTHAERGPISPGEFIPVAEESGLILDLGRWAMDRAAATMAEWDRAVGEKLPFYVAVNLSAIQIARDDVAGCVEDAMRAHRIPGNRLRLELTESAIVQDPSRATRVFEGLKALDTTLAMDDFGTGYSSLAYLQKLPIDVLKIDQSFVRDMLSDQDSVAIVRAILSLAEALGMSTTAEGIESVELATTLSALGCGSGQGYHFARPLPAEDALRYYRERSVAVDKRR